MKKQLAMLTALMLAALMLLTGCGKKDDYKNAMTLYDNGQYQEAAEIFSKLGNFEDSPAMANVCWYEAAKALFDAESYEDARGIFVNLGDYESSADYVDKCDHKLMLQQYADVFKLLDGETWFFSGEINSVLNGITFSADSATVAQVWFDGNGKHESSSNDCPFTIDDKNITVTTADGSDMTIAYTVSGSGITLGQNEYFSTKDVDAALQGYWKCRNTSYVLGHFATSEHNIYINNGKMTSESASEAYGYNDGSYYYYGPYEGTYTIGFGGFETDMYHGNEWFFTINDGEILLLHYDHACEPTNKLPGEDGYSF